MGFYRKVVAFGSQVEVEGSMNNKIPIANLTFYLMYKRYPYPL